MSDKRLNKAPPDRLWEYFESISAFRGESSVSSDLFGHKGFRETFGRAASREIAPCHAIGWYALRHGSLWFIRKASWRPMLTRATAQLGLFTPNRRRANTASLTE